ncbi:glycosyl hydrolase family protein [Sarocladium strictum]
MMETTDLSAADREQDSPTQSSFRPSFHVTAPSGWLNDPCGPGYDPSTGLYHIFFQWNPHGNVWGNMSWGHATSRDLVSWDTNIKPAIEPSAEYDYKGVFTGCLHATDIDGSPGGLTIAYTSVSNLPIHYTLPYVIGSETLSLAVSSDGGETWQRSESNPILPGPPSNLSVTGWRDPSLTMWNPGGKNNESSSLYGVISGGIVDKSPTAFIYKLDATNLRNWEYAGPLIDVGLNFCPSRWSGDFGINWEVANLMTLTNTSGDTRDFVIIKVEGASFPEKESFAPDAARRTRHPRLQQWMCLRPSHNHRMVDDPLTEYAFAGILDHGCFLAANAFCDPITSQHLVYGWITEEDLSTERRLRQGWSSLISLPRVVQLSTLENVLRARKSPLQSITSLEVVPGSSEDTYTVHTLGIRPEPRLSGLRRGCEERQPQDVTLPGKLSDAPSHFIALVSGQWELMAEIAVSQTCNRVGIQVAHDSKFEHCTTLAWHPEDETFTIHRPPPEDADTNHGFDSAPHTLFTYKTEQDEETEENLQVHAFFDQSVLEVFVNERTVISTRVYHSAGRCYGVRFFAEVGGDDVVHGVTKLVRASAWDGIGKRV